MCDMGDRTTFRLDDKQIQALEDMVEHGHAGNQTEAMKNLLDAGMPRYGVGPVAETNGGQRALSAVANKLGLILGVVGISWLAVTLTYPVPMRMPAMFAMSASAGSFGLSRAVDWHCNGMKSTDGGV